MAVYKIVIEDKTSKSSNPVAGQETASTTSQASSKRQISMNDVGLFVAYRQVKPFISQLVSNEVQKVGLRTGSNRQQEIANFNHKVLSKVVSLGESIAIGAATGGLPGALIGAGVGLTHSIISYVNNEIKLDISKSIEDEGLRTNTIRAGAGRSRKNE